MPAVEENHVSPGEVTGRKERESRKVEHDRSLIGLYSEGGHPLMPFERQARPKLDLGVYAKSRTWRPRNSEGADLFPLSARSPPVPQ